MEDIHYKLTFASKDGELIHISKVQKGLKCGCYCPACGEKMVAKKGNQRMHHFAHYSSVNCEYGYETSLHMLAKKIISKSKKFVIPAVYINDQVTHEKKKVPSKEIKVDEVRLEKRYDEFIPDIVLVSGEKELFVEIYVSHKVTDEKLAKIKKIKTSVIEIDLNQYNREVNFENLSRILLEESYLKKWLYNAYVEKLEEQNDIPIADEEKKPKTPFFSENLDEVKEKLVKTEDLVVDKNGYRLMICMHCHKIKNADLFLPDVSYIGNTNIGCCTTCRSTHIFRQRR